MQFSVFAVCAVLASTISAQSLGSIPQCAADNCVSKLLPANCHLDPTCICQDKTFITQISCCVFQNCPASDQQAALDYAKTLCTPAGAQLPASAGCSSGASSAATAASSASSSGASSSVASSAASATSSASSRASSAAASASSATSSAAAAATSSAAGEKLAAHGMGLFGAVVGAVALL